MSRAEDEIESFESDVIYEEENEVDSDIESDEYDLPYDGEDDDIDGEGKPINHKIYQFSNPSLMILSS